MLIVQVAVPQEESTGDYYYRAYAPGIGMTQCEGVYTLNLTIGLIPEVIRSR